MGSRGMSRCVPALVAGFFFLGMGTLAHAHQPGLAHLEGKKAGSRLSGAAGGGKAPAHPGNYREGEVLVKIKASALPKNEKDIESAFGVEKARKLRSDKVVPGLYVLKLKAGDTVEGKVKEIKGRSDVDYVQPNYIYRAQTTPNDPLFKQQWDMYNTGQTVQGQVGKAGADMKMPAAWGISTGSKDVVVAVVDTGIDYYNPDLTGNLWTNPSPGSFDSVNYPNDIHGINPIVYDNYSGNPYTDPDDPYDDESHGTHVSGTIGASGNNGAGVAGMNWNVSIMALKGLDYNGQGADADLIECINYAVFEKGLYDSNHQDGANVRVINASWGGPAGSSSDQALYNAIQTAGDSPTYILFVAAAGNNGPDGQRNGGTSNDDPATLTYPASWAAATYSNGINYPALPNMIAVAATDNKDNLASFSNYGPNSVAVAAPGVDILSTLPVLQRLYFDNFEHGMAWNGIPWTRGSFPPGVNNTWGLTTESYFSPTHSLASNPGTVYKPNTDNWAIWGPFDLSTVKWPIKLEYHLKLATELGYDGLYVDISPDGSSTPNLWPAVDGWTGTTTGYEDLTTDISSLIGSKNAYIAFELFTDSSGTGMSGAHVDDVSVAIRPSGPQPAGAYGYDTGTSMAAPHVTGLAALIMAANPNLSMSQVKDTITGTVDKLPVLNNMVSSGGRVNGMKALASAVGDSNGDALNLTVRQDGGYTILTATLIYGGSLQYGRSVRFYQDNNDGSYALIGTALTGAYTSATPGIATLKVYGKAGDHTAYAASVPWATGVTSLTSSTFGPYHTYPPTIDTVTSAPSSTVGSTVTVTGSYFGLTKGYVYLTGGSPVVATAITPLTWTDNGSLHGASLTFRVPVRVAGNYYLTVKNVAMTSGTGGDPPTTYTIVPPTITGFVPASAGPGMTVTIGGTGFGPVTGSISLKSSTNVVTAVVPISGSWTDTSVQFKVPSIKGDSYAVSVKNAAATSVPAGFTIPPPVITGLSPSDTASVGNVITINGTGFGLVTGSISLKSSLNVVTAVIPITGSWKDTSIQFKVPALKHDTYQLTVKNASATSAPAGFTIPPPVITGLSPSDTASVGNVITINGTGFGLVTGSISLKSVTSNLVTPVAPIAGSWKDTSIQFKVPSIKYDPKGYLLTVKNTAGASSVSFNIPLPAVSSLTPPSAAAGVPVSINGTGFGMITGTISLKSSLNVVTAVIPITGSWKDTSIQFKVPALKHDTYQLTVKNSAATSAPAGFTIPLPAIASLNLASAAPGVPVTITGTGFGMTKGSVLLTTTSGTITTTPITPAVWGDTSITFNVPGLKAGSYNLAVKNTSSLTATTWGDGPFTIPLPNPTLVSPANATVGTTGVSITGSDFGTVKGTVLFKTQAGVLAATVTPTTWPNTGTSLTFTVPAIAKNVTYNLFVKNAAGTSNTPVPPLVFKIIP